MSEIEGVVRRVEKGTAVVEVVRASGCGKCHEPGGCGGGVLAVGASCRSYALYNNIHAVEGDVVLVSVADGSILRAAIWAYVLPGALMLIGALVATVSVGSDWAAVLGAVAGLGCGYGILRRFPRVASLSMRFK